MTTNDYSPERLADRAQIQDVMYRWCRAVDRLDIEGIRGVFHPDAIDNHGPFVGGVDALIAWLTNRHRGIPFSMHLVSNILIEFAGPDSALVETYIFATLRYSAEGKAALAAFTGGVAGGEGSATDSFSWARYIDRFERRGGEWRIARRTVAFDSSLMTDVPSDAQPSTRAGPSAGGTGTIRSIRSGRRWGWPRESQDIVMKSKNVWCSVFIVLAAASAHAQPPDKEKLDQIDRGFVCPESLPDVKTKQASLEEFMKQVAAAWPTVTVAQFTAFRMALLERHQCTYTLESIRRHNQLQNNQR